jgi:hypothetical protein
MLTWVKTLFAPLPPQTDHERHKALKNRKRSLSIDKVGRRTKKQNQSPFFSKLPPEIRLIIYEMVLCETAQVHIIVKSSKRNTTQLYGRTCAEPRRYCPPGSLCRVQSQLLLTCRLM